MSHESLIDVIVVGAGMAGLAAGRALAEAGRRVVILEASQRIGGRIHTVREGGEVIELGAEFVHGRPPQLWALIEEAGLATYERTGTFFHREGGEFVAGAEEGGEDEPLEQLKEFTGPDCSFFEYAQRLGLSEEEMAEELGYVEGFNAADAHEASAVALGRQQVAEDAIDGDLVWRLTDGYDRLPAFLRARFEAAGGKIVFGARVTGVDWGADGVAVKLADGTERGAKQCVVTVPLGVLQAGVIHFVPSIPILEQAVMKMRMGQVCRFTLSFKERLWPEEMSFLLTRELLPNVWWTARPQDERILTGWVGGPRSAELLKLGETELRERALAAAADALGMSLEEVRAGCDGFHMYDWSADELFGGAYSWVPVGGLETSEQMSQPVGDVLYVAGEHTDTTGHWGTVHAALGSGLRAAGQILKCERVGEAKGVPIR